MAWLTILEEKPDHPMFSVEEAKARNWRPTGKAAPAHSNIPMLPAILVPDAQDSYAEATMLLESGGYRTDYVYEVMMGEKNNNIKLTALLAEGADYERISFQWAHPPAAKT